MKTSATRVQAELRIQRTALVALAVILPALGIAYAAISASDPVWSRFVLGGIGLGLVGASYASVWVREQFTRISLAFWTFVLLVVLYFAAESNFEYSDLVGVIVMQFVLLVVFPRPRYAVFTQGLLLSGVVAAVVILQTPGGHPAFLIGLPLALATAGFTALRGRETLIKTVETQRAELEIRVAERTAQLEEEVRQRRAAEAEAKAASEAKSLFLTRMSHELRTPINAIVGYTELVREDAEDQGLEGVTSDLDQVLTASAQLLRMVDDVLDVSRIEAGELELAPVETPISEAVERAVTAIGRGAEANGNRLVVEPVPTAQMTVDASRLAQILGNLLHNAARFTRDGTITLRTAVTDSHAVFEVEDTGIGIPAAAHDAIFEPFTQADESSVREVDGAGLGLFIARDLASRMGGELAVDSEVGTGSRFRLTLPLSGAFEVS